MWPQIAALLEIMKMRYWSDIIVSTYPKKNDMIVYAVAA